MLFFLGKHLLELGGNNAIIGEYTYEKIPKDMLKTMFILSTNTTHLMLCVSQD